MYPRTRIQQIKLVVKVSIAVCVVLIFIVLGIFVRPASRFENAHMKKWMSLSQQQRIEIINQVAKDSENQDILVACVTKIANLPDSHSMIIHDAISLCYNGLKLNAQQQDEK